MARFIYLVFLLIGTLPALAQTLVGTVREASAQPAAFAALKLLRATDSTFVGGTISDENGQYRFADIAEGTYRIQASLVGMNTVMSPVVTVRAGQSLTLETLTFRPASQLLTAVTVRAQKPFVEQQADKTVLNVAANATAQGKTAYELLQQAPGVVVDPNDNIRMAGKQGVLVYIDGKPTNLSARDVANLLRATPAANIDKVELITNPSARYDAQGGAGIINIKFRRDKGLGLNGNASGGYGQSDHYRANAAIDLNYRAKHLNLYGNLAGSDNFQITNVSINRSLTGAQFTQRGYDSDGTRGAVYKAGADYFVGSRHTIGLLVTGNTSANRFSTATTTDIFGKRATPDSSLTNLVNSPSQNNRFNTALNYQYADTLGFSLTLDADYTRFGNSAPSRIRSAYVGADRQPLFNTQNRFDATTDITIWTFRADLAKEWKARNPAGATMKLEGGLKHTDVATDNDLLAFTDVEDRPDVGRTNRFTYREIVTAAYTSLNRRVGKWAMQAGLRAENSTVRGRSTDLQNRTVNRPDTAYLNLFPTAYVQYQATENGQLSLSYGRRIGRPNYQDMNPFVYQIDPYTSQRGNPFLRPTYTHNAEVSYTYKWATTIKLAYSRTSDYATDVIRQENLSAYQTVANVGQAEVLNLSVNTPLPITKWWNGYFYAGATWNRFRGSINPGEPFDQRAFAFEAYMQHSFTLSKVWEAQVSGFWNAPTRQTIYRIGGLGALNLSLQKKLFQDRGRLTISADDLLNTMRWKQAGAFGGGGQQFDIYRKWESRRVSVRFSYRFGSKDVKSAREREANTSAGRIKEKGNF